MTAFVWVFLPETKGVPIEEMRLLWRRHPVWRRILGAEPHAADAAHAAPGTGASGEGMKGLGGKVVEGGVGLDGVDPQEGFSVGSAKPWRAAV